MIKSITLKNFRKHTDSRFTFTQGFNCVRGENEGGKTTIIEGIMYALFGTKALRDSLAEAVTYDQPESSLKATLELTVDGVDYTVTRGKSGAEIRYADQLVSGQTETRTFFERLLGCTADTACRLMFADQNSVRGVLEEGGTAANALVETLADLDVIETLIDKITEQLPSGNTKIIDSKIETLKSTVVEIPEVLSKDRLNAVLDKIKESSAKIEALKASTPNDLAVSEARALIRQHDTAKARLAHLEQVKLKLTEALAKKPEPCLFSEDDLQRKRAEVANEAEQVRRLQSYKLGLDKLEHESTWSGNLESAVRFRSNTKDKIEELQSSIQDTKLELNTAKLKRINEKTCAFCKKDLSDVPEVATINEAVDLSIAKLSEKLARLTADHKDAKDDYDTIDAVIKLTYVLSSSAGEYWVADTTNLPPTFTWKGDIPVVGNAAQELAAMESAWKKYQAELTSYRDKEEELIDLQSEKVELPDIQDALSVIDAREAAESLLKDLLLEKHTLELEEAKAESELESNLREIQAAKRAAESYAKELTDLKAARDQMLYNNALISKLRSARPQIAAQMWGTVLGAISHYFTQIRGESSVVTRDTAGFKVNGKGVKGLSGSTLDALGLAIRMSLSKLFLPGVSMMFLDESFAGCSDSRELNGVGTLVGSGFSQVILVTHSPLPEASADNLVTI